MGAVPQIRFVKARGESYRLGKVRKRGLALPQLQSRDASPQMRLRVARIEPYRLVEACERKIDIPVSQALGFAVEIRARVRGGGERGKIASAMISANPSFLTRPP